MPFLRTNYKNSRPIDNEWGAFGWGYQNWIAGSGINFDRRQGGLLVGSFASQLSGAGFLALSALDGLTSTYGATLVSNFIAQAGLGSLGSATTGFKMIPFAFLDASGDGGSAAITAWTFSATQAIAGDDSVVIVLPRKYAVSGPVTSASNISIRFVYHAWIVSVPSVFR